MARKDTPDNSRPRGGTYRFKGSLGPADLGLVKTLLATIEAECPTVIEEWKALYPLAHAAVETQPGEYYDSRGIIKHRRGITGAAADAKNAAYEQAFSAWADCWYLNSEIVRAAAHQGLELAARYGGAPRWRRSLSTELIYMPTLIGIKFEAEDSAPGELPGDYQARIEADFKTALAAHVARALQAFEDNPAVEREREIRSRNDEDIGGSRRPSLMTRAVRWQVLKEGPTGDVEAVRKLLKRLRFRPRPGL